MNRQIEEVRFRPVTTLDELMDRRGPALLQLQAADDRIPKVAPLWLDAPAMVVNAHDAPMKTEAVTLASFSDVIVSGASLVGSETVVFALGSPLMPGYVPHYLKAGWIEGATEPLSGKDQRRVSGASVLLTHFNTGVYGHWLLEGLPKLMLIRRLAQSLPSLSILLPSSTPAFVRAWCEFLTPKDIIITYDDRVEFVRCENLLVPGLLASQDYVFHPLMGDLIRESIEAAAPGARKTPPALYVTRVDQSHYRRMENGDEIESIAKSKGLALVSPESFPICEQIRLFSEGKFVAGEYGSALHNTIFSGAATVLALNWINNCQSRIAHFRQQRLAYIVPESGPVTYERDLGGIQRGYRIDPGAFASALDQGQSMTLARSHV